MNVLIGNTGKRVFFQFALHKNKGREPDYVGQLIVTPKMVPIKIRDLKVNKSPGVDGIPPKSLLEIVEQISIPLATMFNVIRGGNSSVRMERR